MSAFRSVDFPAFVYPASATTGVSERFEPVRLLLPYEEGHLVAELYGLGAPIDERVDGPDGVFVRAHLPRRELTRFAPYLVAEARDDSKAREAPASSA